MIGAFAQIGNGQDSVALNNTERVPASGELGARAIASAHEHTPTDVSWALRVTAVCANVGP